jgi:predicted alpha/beta hydrolase family esterase
MSTLEIDPTVVIVPGLRDAMPEHWQSLLQLRLRHSYAVPRMERDSPDKLSCEAWVARLDATLARVGEPVVLVAHSAGVAIVAHWAQRHTRAIRGALLATPPDFETPLPAAYPPLETFRANGWMPLPRTPLPFPSIVAASTNDPLGEFERVAALARDWGSRLVDVGPVGHLNPAAGFGWWPQAETLLTELVRDTDPELSRPFASAQ